jgi:hypothetical protein
MYWGLRAVVHTRLGAQPAPYITGTEQFPQVKRPGRGVNLTSNAEVKERVKLHIYPLCAFMAVDRVNFTLTFMLGLHVKLH